MVIAYSCAGEGFGHAGRVAALAPALAAEHELHCFAPSTVRSYLRDRLPGLPLHWIPAFAFVKRGNRVMLLSSFRRGLRLATALPAIARRLARRLRAIGADAVISDFDPFLAWAGRMAGLPVLQLNHPGIVQRYPSFFPRALAGVACTRLMEGPFTERIWTSFYGGRVGPILRKTLSEGERETGDFILVNLAERLRDAVLPELAWRGVPFRVFPGGEGSYDEALRRCRAVISTGGHQTAAESLALGKPLLAIPQDGQYEQRLNARMVERARGGMSCRIGDFARVLPKFLASIEEFRSPGGGGFDFRDGREEAVRLILEFIGRRAGRGAERGGEFAIDPVLTMAMYPPGTWYGPLGIYPIPHEKIDAP